MKKNCCQAKAPADYSPKAIAGPCRAVMKRKLAQPEHAGLAGK